MQAIISGIAVGCVYALVALGFVLIYKATEVINFAQGELMMLGAFVAYSFIELFRFPFFMGLFATVITMAIFAAALNHVVMRRLVGQSPFSIVLATLALGILLRSVVSMTPGWGVETYGITSPVSGGIVSFGAIVISLEHLTIIFVTAALVAVLFLFFTFTKLGVALQATSQNQLAASYVGIPIRSMFSLIWGISAAVAAIAGILLAPIAFVHVNMGFIGLKAFPAAVLGGFGSIPGAILGGLIIGVVEELAGFYFPEGFKDVAAYVVLLAVLFIRPQGLFGVSLKERV